MSFWQFLKRLFGLRQAPPSPDELRTFHLESDLARSVQELAQEEQRSGQELAAELIASGVVQRYNYQDVVHRWWTLTAREQQVAALICQDYTNALIAERLRLSPETVRTHVRNVLRKFGLRNRRELYFVLVLEAGWEFYN